MEPVEGVDWEYYQIGHTGELAQEITHQLGRTTDIARNPQARLGLALGEAAFNHTIEIAGRESIIDERAVLEMKILFNAVINRIQQHGVQQ